MKTRTPSLKTKVYMPKSILAGGIESTTTAAGASCTRTRTCHRSRPEAKTTECLRSKGLLSRDIYSQIRQDQEKGWAELNSTYAVMNDLEFMTYLNDATGTHHLLMNRMIARGAGAGTLKRMESLWRLFKNVKLIQYEIMPHDLPYALSQVLDITNLITRINAMERQDLDALLVVLLHPTIGKFFRRCIKKANKQAMAHQLRTEVAL